jgi:hypothetical protein
MPCISVHNDLLMTCAYWATESQPDRVPTRQIQVNSIRASRDLSLAASGFQPHQLQIVTRCYVAVMQPARLMHITVFIIFFIITSVSDRGREAPLKAMR